MKHHFFFITCHRFSQRMRRENLSMSPVRKYTLSKASRSAHSSAELFCAVAGQGCLLKRSYCCIYLGCGLFAHFLHICLPVSLPISSFLHSYLYTYISPIRSWNSICLSLYLHVYLFDFLCIRPGICLSTCLLTSHSVSQYISLYTFLSVYQPTSLFETSFYPPTHKHTHIHT